MKNTEQNDFGFYEVLLNLNIGVLALDIINEKIVFQNITAIKILKTISYEKLINMFGINLLQLHQVSPHQNKLTLKDRILGFTVYPLFDRYFWVLISDITEKERLEKIAEATTHLDNIGYIFSGMAHEIGNPLNAIKTAISVLKENIENFSREKVIEYLQNIISEINRIEYLLKSMKTFNAYEQVDLHIFDFTIFFDNFIKLIEKDVKKRGITLSVNLNRNVGLVKANTRALQQILLNLLTNAMDAVKEVQYPKILVEAKIIKKTISITINDNGIGLSKDEMEKLFIPFYTTKAKGTGLGLTIARKLLLKMDGSISVNSKPGLGTTFTIQLMSGNNE
jgi:signal transduction histidine kinase